MPSAWSAHQLAEFLAAVSAFPDEQSAIDGALERAAAALDAEVGAIVRNGLVTSSIGFPPEEAPTSRLLDAASSRQDPVELPDLGECRSAFAVLEDDTGGTLMLARVGGEGFRPEEQSLLRGMARVLTLSLRMHRTLDEERNLRLQSELEASERKKAEQRLATQHQAARVLAGASTEQGAFPPLLRAVCRRMGLDGGSIWLANEPDGALTCAAFWPAPSSDAEAAPGTFDPRRSPADLRTRAWNEVKPVAGRHVGPGGGSAGVERSTFALPIVDGSNVLGVIELTGGAALDPQSPEAEMLVEGIGTQVGQFITRRRAEEELAHHALHDPLTGLPNRTLLIDRIRQALDRAKRTSTLVAVLFLDIDRFKLVNDSLGHQVGDSLLKLFAERLEGALRSTDSVIRLTTGTLARLGGDEFVVLFEDLSAERDAISVAERIESCLAAPFMIEGIEMDVTVSVGVAVSGGEETNPDSLLRDADLAMYRAKDSGRDRFELFDEQMRTRVLDRITLERDLRKALERDQFTLHYQPVVSLDDASVIGVEALLRWQHPERGLIPPAEFIPIAEDSGLIVPIGEWVLREGCAQLARWQAAGACRDSLQLSVNISARQMTAELPATVAGILEETGIDPSLLWLEITESLLIEQAEPAGRWLEQLKELGAKLVLDDFGTGYSSLSYLHRFSPDTLKLDRSFISVLGRDAKASTLVAATLEMARTLELSVVAEGVETAEQAEALRKLSCPLAQGFFFARPQPPELIEPMLGGERKRALAHPGGVFAYKRRPPPRA